MTSEEKSFIDWDALDKGRLNFHVQGTETARLNSDHIDIGERPEPGTTYARRRGDLQIPRGSDREATPWWVYLVTAPLALAFTLACVVGLILAVLAAGVIWAGREVWRLLTAPCTRWR